MARLALLVCFCLLGSTHSVTPTPKPVPKPAPTTPGSSKSTPGNAPAPSTPIPSPPPSTPSGGGGKNLTAVYVLGALGGLLALGVAVFFLCRHQIDKSPESAFMRDGAEPLVGQGGVEMPYTSMPHTSIGGQAMHRSVPRLHTSPQPISATVPTAAIVEEYISNSSQLSNSAFGEESDVVFGEKIAQGGAAAVYKGTYQFAPVAIKKILPTQGAGGKAKQLERQEKDIKDMEDEAFVMSKLRHPNIVQFFCILEHEGQLCLVMELMSGGSLRDMIDNRADELTLATKIRIIWEASKGLCYLHTLESPIIHRDVKAANILLDDRKRAKLTDFGISRITEGAEHGLTSFSGTVAWMAPELLNAQSTYTSKVDIYSFGMVLFEALTLEIPFNGMHMGQIVMTVVHESQRPALWNTQSAPEKAAQELMVRCWAQLPEDRPTAEEVTLALQHTMALASQAGL